MTQYGLSIGKAAGQYKRSSIKRHLIAAKQNSCNPNDDVRDFLVGFRPDCIIECDRHFFLVRELCRSSTFLMYDKLYRISATVIY